MTLQDYLALVERLLHVLNDLSPLALAVLLGSIILLIVHKNGPVRKIQDNHLTHIEAAITKVANNSDKQLDKLDEIRSEMSWVKGKLS